MDILLSSFVDKNIDLFNEQLLDELDKFLNFEDEVILNYYQHDIIKENIDKNEVSKMFKEFKL